MQRRQGNRNKVRSAPAFKSVFRDTIIKGYPKQIAQKYTDLAAEANEHDREALLQHADHWGRVASLSV